MNTTAILLLVLIVVVVQRSLNKEFGIAAAFAFIEVLGACARGALKPFLN
jgi:hypothetical protein